MPIAKIAGQSIKAVVFDAYGTLVNVHGIAEAAERFFNGSGARLSALWREKQVEYTRLRTMSAQHASFAVVTRQSLAFACAALQLKITPEIEQQLMLAYLHLPAWPEAREALTSLRDSGMPLSILSNGDPADLDQLVENAGLADLIPVVLSAQSVQKYKTAPEVYELGTREFKCSAHELLFVSSNSWDACGAAWFGYTTCWVNRTGAVPEHLEAPVQFTVASLSDLSTLFA